MWSAAHTSVSQTLWTPNACDNTVQSNNGINLPINKMFHPSYFPTLICHTPNKKDKNHGKTNFSYILTNNNASLTHTCPNHYRRRRRHHGGPRLQLHQSFLPRHHIPHRLRTITRHVRLNHPEKPETIDHDGLVRERGKSSIHQDIRLKTR